MVPEAAAPAEAEDRRKVMTAEAVKETGPDGKVAMGQPLIELKNIYKIEAYGNSCDRARPVSPGEGGGAD